MSAARLNGTRPDDSPRARRLSLAAPLFVWGISAAVVAVGAWAFGYDPWDSATWSRFDSGLYEDIARDGYDLFRCDPAVFGPGTWCGDAGWFPGYSWLVGALHVVGLPLRGSAVARTLRSRKVAQMSTIVALTKSHDSTTALRRRGSPTTCSAPTSHE